MVEQCTRCDATKTNLIRLRTVWNVERVSLLSDRLEIISMPLHRPRSCWIRRWPFVKQRARVSSACRTTGPLTETEERNRPQCTCQDRNRLKLFSSNEQDRKSTGEPISQPKRVRTNDTCALDKFITSMPELIKSPELAKKKAFYFLQWKHGSANLVLSSQSLSTKSFSPLHGISPTTRKSQVRWGLFSDEQSMFL